MLPEERLGGESDQGAALHGFQILDGMQLDFAKALIGGYGMAEHRSQARVMGDGNPSAEQPVDGDSGMLERCEFETVPFGFWPEAFGERLPGVCDAVEQFPGGAFVGGPGRSGESHGNQQGDRAEPDLFRMVNQELPDFRRCRSAHTVTIARGWSQTIPAKRRAARRVDLE